MKKIVYSIVYALCLFCFTSCEYDNYEAPAETFKGTVIDNTTGKGLQTEVGDGGVRFKMLELSWSNNPTPWYFTCKQDGQFQDTKVFEGNYNITPLGAFVPFVQTDNTGKITKDESLTIDIKGTVTHEFKVDPFLAVSWVGEPVANSNSTISTQIKIERGTTDPNFQQNCIDVYLYVNYSSPYVGNNNYDSRYSVHLSGADANNAVGKTITLTTPVLPGNRIYYVRAGARIDYSVDGSRRYNYNEPKQVKVS